MLSWKDNYRVMLSDESKLHTNMYVMLPFKK